MRGTSCRLSGRTEVLLLCGTSAVSATPHFYLGLFLLTDPKSENHKRYSAHH
jgi:hypothetical protein